MSPIAIRPTAFLVALALLLTAVGSAAWGAETLHRGTWTEKGFRIDGGWSIVDDGGKLWVVLDDGFRTKNAPDLKLFLSPTSLAQLNNRNATQGSRLVAQLDSPKGGQRYAIPAGTDLSAFRTLIIHCEKYSKLWGGAELR